MKTWQIVLIAGLVLWAMSKKKQTAVAPPFNFSKGWLGDPGMGWQP